MSTPAFPSITLQVFGLNTKMFVMRVHMWTFVWNESVYVYMYACVSGFIFWLPAYCSKDRKTINKDRSIGKCDSLTPKPGEYPGTTADM